MFKLQTKRKILLSFLKQPIFFSALAVLRKNSRTNGRGGGNKETEALLPLTK